jgi:hypothetical protein
MERFAGFCQSSLFVQEKKKKGFKNAAWIAPDVPAVFYSFLPLNTACLTSLKASRR